jgi:hypothetical protein
MGSILQPKKNENRKCADEGLFVHAVIKKRLL